MALEELFKVAATVIQAGAVIVTAYYASKGLNAWRRQLLGKRKIEVAEEALVATYKARSALTWVRNPGAFGGEGSTRPRGENESDAMTARMDTYFVPLERIQKFDNDLAQFAKVRVLAQVYFGPDAGEPFGEIIRAFNQVAFAARTLISTIKQHRGPGGDPLIHKWEAEIWEGGEDDEIAKRVKNAVDQIERLCRSHLKEV